MAGEGDRRAGSDLEGRRSKVLGGLGSDGRSVGVALLSTVVFFGLVGFAITHSPGWHEVRRTFFDWHEFTSSLPGGSRQRVQAGTVKIFCIAEVLILILALLIAVIRSLPGPVFFPLRALAIAYTDFFRGVPTILVIALLGFGAPWRSSSSTCRSRRRSGGSSR